MAKRRSSHVGKMICAVFALASVQCQDVKHHELTGVVCLASIPGVEIDVYLPSGR